MKRRKLPNYREAGRRHHQRTDYYVDKYLTEMGDRLAVDAVQLIDRLGIEIDHDEVFGFDKHPELKPSLQKMRAGYAAQLRALILNGVAREWAEASNLQDEMALAVLNARGVLDEARDLYPMLGRPNEEALSAFIARRDKGMWLSQRIWNLSGATQTQLEAALATGIDGGWDAVTLSKRVSKYLHDFPSLQRDYTERFGHATHILDAEYRSARLARTEINIAYRSAEQQRWGELDFVRGYEVKRSGRGYDCPVCQDLSGKYPKDFVWAGWHPNCRCYAIPILNTEEEFFSHKTSSQNDVTDTPENFKEWIEANRERLGRANERGTLPYFVRDNPHYVQLKKVQEEPKRTPKPEPIYRYAPRQATNPITQARIAQPSTPITTQAGDTFSQELLKDRRAKGSYITPTLGKPITINGETYTQAYVTDKQVLHATRDTKQGKGKTISLEDFLGRMQKDFSSFDEWRYDERNDSYLTAVRYLDEHTALKYVFKVHKKVEGVKGNENKLHFITAGVVEATNVTQYKKID